MSKPTDFWSRRKAAVREAEAAEKRERENKAREDQDQASAEMSDEEILANLELPDPDSMQAGDDFSAFLSAAVPEHLRRRALRSLWKSNPVLANVDGLNDYDDDYSNTGSGIGILKTAYRVGKGFLQSEEGDDSPDLENPATPDLPARDDSNTDREISRESDTNNLAAEKCDIMSLTTDRTSVQTDSLKDSEEGEDDLTDKKPLKRRMRFV